MWRPKNLWAEEAVPSNQISVVKVAREVNAADSLASFSATTVLRYHTKLVNLEVIDDQERTVVGMSFHSPQPWASDCPG